MSSSPVRRVALLLLLIAAPGTSAAAAGPVIVSGLAPDASGAFDADRCRGCDANAQGLGICDNTCIDGCHDPARTTYTGTGCGQFDGNQSACQAGWQLGSDGVPASCFFYAPTSACLFCTSGDQKNGLCTNSCFPCEDASRTILAGDAFNSCRQFDDNPTACAAAWFLSFNGVPVSCFVEAGTNDCLGCGVGERIAGLCDNSCTSCADPARTSFTSLPGETGCNALFHDQAACESTWHDSRGFVPTTCFYTPGTNQNQGGFLYIQDGFDSLGPQVTNGRKLAVCLGCNGTTAAGGFDAGFDESTLPELGWSRTTLTDPQDIENFFYGSGPSEIVDAGIVYMPSQETDSSHAGISAEQVAVINLYASDLAAFVANGGGLFVHNQARLEGGFRWLGAVVPGAAARPGPTCHDEEAFTPAGTAVFPNVTAPILDAMNNDSAGYFLADSRVVDVLATDLCRDVTCKDPAHPRFRGGPDDDLCAEIGVVATCNAAWHLTRSGLAAICSYEAGMCISCGRNVFGEDPCPNTCAACDDPARTMFTGGLSSVGCEGLGDDETACAMAWQGAGDGLNASCFFDAAAGFCRVCSTENEVLDLCANTCEPPPGVRAVVIRGTGAVIVTTTTVTTTTTTSTAALPTTTTTTTSTTTTTRPVGCGPPAPTFVSIDCRLDVLIADLQAAQDLGKVKSALLKLAMQARERKIAAEQLVGPKRKLAVKRLKQAIKKMVAFNFRVRSLVVRQKTPGGSRQALADQGKPIHADMKTLLRTL